jgi:hypothetical protein
LDKLGVNFSGVSKGKLFGKTEATTNFGENFPIWFRLSWRLAEGLTQSHHTFGVGHHASFFTPLGCW